MSAVWLSGNDVGLINEVTLRRTGLEMGDRSGQLSLAIPPEIVEMSTSDVYMCTPLPLGKKQRVLRNSKSSDQNCWHTGLIG